MVHCALPPGAVTTPVRHRTVDELWFVVGGSGQVWRRQADREETVEVTAGTALSIPVGTSFQFRSTSEQALEIVITTVPAWPGDDEAVVVEGCWDPRPGTA